MNPDEPGSIFQAPTGPHVEEHPTPTVDGSDEARRRLRHPFDVPRTDAPGPHPDGAGARRGGRTDHGADPSSAGRERAVR